jgi:hypothetical protein
MHQKTRHANATATAPSAQTTHVAATATPARAIDTAATALLASDTDTEMQYTADCVHQPNSKRTNWRKLKEQAQKNRSKKREVLIEVNPDACFCPLDSNEEKSTR